SQNTLRTVKQKILSYERAIFAASTLSSTASVEANRVIGQQSQRKSNRQKSGKAKSWADLEGKCTCCGAKEHKAAQCPKRTSSCNRAIPDTGATRTMLSLDVAQRHGLQLDATSDKVKAANGDQMSVAGRVVLELTVDCLVSSCMHNCMLISWHDLQNLGVIGPAFPLAASGEINTAVEDSSAIEEMKQDLRRQFHDVLSDSLAPDQRVVGDPIQIRLTEDAVPYHANTSRPIPLHYRAEADATIKRLLDSGRISCVEEATTWCARAHFVPKEGGKAGL
ncbi:hypothetical protein TCAL_11338, partial [Tigriopus californicus]